MTQPLKVKFEACRRNAKQYKLKVQASQVQLFQLQAENQELKKHNLLLRKQNVQILKTLQDMQHSNNRRKEANRKLTDERNNLKDLLVQVHQNLEKKSTTTNKEVANKIKAALNGKLKKTLVSV